MTLVRAAPLTPLVGVPGLYAAGHADVIDLKRSLRWAGLVDPREALPEAVPVISAGLSALPGCHDALVLLGRIDLSRSGKGQKQQQGERTHDDLPNAGTAG